MTHLAPIAEETDDEDGEAMSLLEGAAPAGAGDNASVFGLGIAGRALRQIDLWQRAGVTAVQACQRLGVLHNRNWDVVKWHLMRQYKAEAERADRLEAAGRRPQ